MDKSRIIAYTVAVVSEFALAHNMTAQEAFRYLYASPLYERLADESTKLCQLGANPLYGEVE
ncbi:hypothetical protein CIK99_06700 [Prevotella sp. P5-92]|uniref:DUF3791 domain-containing protein n=1 Tax=Prevotella sp. P5-92 TaxID=2024222 RepID=UPI000B9645B8|nr:hypothetical protein [Prevotella sp. P5-92]OYP57601.1 hypothetical protein CIK99_06700 [Prevotella sp. P5-92]